MRIQHARVSLALHEVAQGPGPALLLLHALYGSSADWDGRVRSWPGSVYALDFCGHGDSQWLTAGGYTPELLAGDADCALGHIGRAALAGAGVGAYVALLVAGARPNLVPAALLLPGAGLAGGGAVPDFDAPRAGISDFASVSDDRQTSDPLVAVLDQDVRPVDYVEPFARSARKLLLAKPYSAEPPPWWQAVHESPGAQIVPADADLGLIELATAARLNQQSSG